MIKTARRKKALVGKKPHEYEDAPSGFIWLINAKEPLMTFDKGFGYLGVLAFDGDNEKVQCHFCGKWFGGVGNHLKREHNMTASYYKQAVGLSAGTALISEKAREALVKSGLNKRLQNLRAGGKMSTKTKAKISKTLKRNTMENKNRNNTCPEQLIDRLKALAKKLGRTPTTREISFYSALTRTYGSYAEACRWAGLKVRKNGETLKQGYSIHTKRDYIQFVADFIDQHRKLPEPRHFNRSGSGNLHKYALAKKWDIKELHKKAVVMQGRYTKLNDGHKDVMSFSDDELLDFLRRFKEHHGRQPSYSDAKRGLLPHLSRYSTQFGSWKEALELAGVKN